MTDQTEQTKTCEHKDCEVLISFDRGYRGQNDRRCYEVYVCNDCGFLINMSLDDTRPMTPTEIMQLFVDIRYILDGPAQEAKDQLLDLVEKLDGFIYALPKERKLIK